MQLTRQQCICDEMQEGGGATPESVRLELESVCALGFGPDTPLVQRGAGSGGLKRQVPYDGKSCGGRRRFSLTGVMNLAQPLEGGLAAISKAIVPTVNVVVHHPRVECFTTDRPLG